MILMKLIGADLVASQFLTASNTVSTTLKQVTTSKGRLLQTKVKARASGRPGPNAPTGDYRRSIGLQVQQVGTSVVARVGTNKPQGRRLEFGFVGVDSLGRTYNQQPLPHYGPAFDEVAPGYEQAVKEAIDKALVGGTASGLVGRFL